ncbi:hypothetical protein Rhal01_02536 [Rubritalea halochordaticola]|uniref:Uncharacterized protein n=1 Tax=Rubritalea halochordaticola TaxID=714537 RepID=A0ABP9V0X9_9BACT
MRLSSNIPVLFSISLCSHAFSIKARADAETYHEPHRNHPDILLKAMQALQASDSPFFQSKFHAPDTAYYLRDISFMGRYETKHGYKNLIRCTYIRSSPYIAERSSTSPPRGHSYLVAFSYELKPEYYLPIPMPESASFTDHQLLIKGADHEKYDLRKADVFSTWRSFSNKK